MSTALMTRESVRSLLAKQKEEFGRALSNRIDPDYFVRVALTAINKQPLLLQCTQESLLGCLMDCAQLGLETDSIRGLAYLIPFNDSKRGMVCTLVVGFQGLIDLSYRHPKVKAIRYGTVRKGDYFDYEEGLHPRLVHRPNDDAEPGELTHAYAICELDNGGQTWVVMNKRQVMKAKSSSRSANSNYSPWATHEEAMYAKTAVRQLAKRIPKSRELAEALGKDDDENVIDVQSTTVNASPVVSLELPEPPKDEAPETKPVEQPAAAPPPTPQAAPVAAETKAADTKGKGPAKTKAVEEKQTPPASLFEESEDHKKFRAMVAESLVSEAAVLNYLRNEGLVDDTVSDIRMIPQKRIGTIIRSWDTMVGEIT
jgi:recombination protein RecT